MISDICSEAHHQLSQWVGTGVYKDMEPRIRLLMADLEALRAELDHSPRNGCPAPKFDPITPRLLALRNRINAIPSGNLTQAQWDNVTPVFSSTEALLEDLQSLEIDIWKEPPHE